VQSVLLETQGFNHCSVGAVWTQLTDNHKRQV